MLTSAAAYIVEVSPTQADRTNVTGTATLARHRAGGIRAGGYIVAQLHHPVGDGRAHGTFGSLTTSGLPAGFAAGLSYTGN